MTCLLNLLSQSPVQQWVGYVSNVVYCIHHHVFVWTQKNKGKAICPLSGCVTSSQNVWVTVNCPATQTIEGERVGLSKVQSNILLCLPLVCLYWVCYNHFQEMTSGIRPDSWEMDSPALVFFFFFPPQFLNLAPQKAPVFDLSIFFMLKSYCWCWTFQPPSGWTLIRLAVSHSLEISYAVWACLYCGVIFGELIMEA